MVTARKHAQLLLAVVALVAGLVCLAYGYALRTVTVLVERAQPAPAPAPEEPSAPSLPGEPAPPSPPPPVKEPVAVAEGEMVRDATVGGIVRLPDGQLVRPYTGGSAKACFT